MQRFNTQAIILARTDYGEADRILTLLTPDNGKVKAIAKGVRKSKSKLAGGIELFSVSEISVIVGRSEINTLISTRLITHFGNIVKDLDRTNAAYEIIKTLNKATEDRPEEAYFNLLRQAFEALDDPNINLDIVNAWFAAQLLKLAGHSPNLRTEKSGKALQPIYKYDFDFDAMAFQPGKVFSPDAIKFLRLLFGAHAPRTLQKIAGSGPLAAKAQRLLVSILQQQLRP